MEEDLLERDRHIAVLNSAIVAMGVNLRGCETPNCNESQPRAHVQRSTTLIPTPKGTAEQRTTEQRGESQDSQNRRLEPKWLNFCAFKSNIIGTVSHFSNFCTPKTNIIGTVSHFSNFGVEIIEIIRTVSHFSNFCTPKNNIIGTVFTL